MTWQTAAPRARVCGFCSPPRVIPIGERYLEIGTRPASIRCLDCATTRWGLEPPAELARPEDTSGNEASDAPPRERPWLDWMPRDWKQRAAGE
jgi:hypothetical protein